MSDFLTPAELADELKIPKSWVERAARCGDFPHQKFGRYVRFTAADVEQIKATHQQSQKAAPQGDDWGRKTRRAS